MNKHIFLTLCIFAVTLMAATAATAQRPVRNPVLSYIDVRGGTCSTTDAGVGVITAATPQGALLFNRTFVGQPNPNFCTPVLNPDGSQMTLGQFSQVSGRATVSCISEGTFSFLSFTGLRPNGVYSIWIMNPNPSPGPPVGVGSLGRRALGENTFLADDRGRGGVSATTPEQNLSMFGHVGPCLFNAPFLLTLVYHSDGLTHGADPGLPETAVENVVFIYQ
ncbi:MAG: hypothetical protein WBD27_16925 [Pyrinomonadaceae bacterium]